MAHASMTNQDLAVLMLEFEKAYDRIGWDFMHIVINRLGFDDNYIKAIFATYVCVSSSILVAGGIAKSFPISRSIRQGCPLSPYSFLFVGEALYYFVTNVQLQLKGLQMPLGGELLEAEFVEDTTIYLQGDECNLIQLYYVLQFFTEASGEKINWNKTKGVWILLNDLLQWRPHLDFQWIQRGQIVVWPQLPLHGST